MVQTYSYSYSRHVIHNFLKTSQRGYEIIRKIWPQVDEDGLVYLFRTDQIRWNVAKRVIKLAERLGRSYYFSAKPGLVEQNILTSVKYFQKVEAAISPLSPISPFFLLDKHQLCAIVLEHHTKTAGS